MSILSFIELILKELFGTDRQTIGDKYINKRVKLKIVDVFLTPL